MREIMQSPRASSTKTPLIDIFFSILNTNFFTQRRLSKRRQRRVKAFSSVPSPSAKSSMPSSAFFASSTARRRQRNRDPHRRHKHTIKRLVDAQRGQVKRHDVSEALVDDRCRPVRRDKGANAVDLVGARHRDRKRVAGGEPAPPPMSDAAVGWRAHFSFSCSDVPTPRTCAATSMQIESQ